MELKNKIVFITGSSDGIGKEAAISFAKEGSKIIITYNGNKKGGEDVLNECKKHTEAILLHLDVTDNESIKKCVEDLMKKFGEIDILVNNAGIVSRKNFLEQDKNEIDSQIDVNLKGLMKVTHEVLPHLLKKKGGMILNLASGAAKNGFPGLVTYCASKFGVRGFTRALAKELPERIKIYSINPGRIATKISDFDGTPIKDLVSVIIKTAKEELNVESGGDVDTFWERNKIFASNNI